jgi:hypothetical protein
MSAVNQPSKLYVSSKDTEYGIQGYVSNITLPESILDCKGVELSRAVIPYTLYPIPDYENKFYYSINGVVDSVTLNNNRNFGSIPDLITELNSDAQVQNKPVVFSYNDTVNRISATISTAEQYIFVQAGLTDRIYVTVSDGTGSFTTSTANIVPGRYTLASFQNVCTFAFNQACLDALGPGSNGVFSINTTTKVCTFSVAQSVGSNAVYVDFAPQGVSPERTNAMKALYGFVSNVGYLNYQVSGVNPMNFQSDTVQILAKTLWPSQFALNTRLGYSSDGVSGVGGTAIVGTFLPNIIRTKVIYITTNMAIDDTMNANGAMRSAIAKVPVNATYGGLVVYAPIKLQFGRIVSSNIQRVSITILDDNLQPYALKADESWELEFSFAY